MYANPRTVKEADALYGAGFDVRVAFTEGNLEQIRALDDCLLKSKPWRFSTVGWSPFRKKERALYLKTKLRYHIFKRLPSFLFPFAKCAEYGEGRLYKELCLLASSEKADLYIGHYPIGLAAAAYAASRWGSKLAYDVEDFHTQEEVGQRVKRRISLIEGRYLPGCAYVSCVSELVAEELAKLYNISNTLVIHNVFPWEERAKIDGQIKDRKGDALSLYWYSQVIGENRGIEDTIRAAGLLKDKVQLHLRGWLTEEVKNKFLKLAKQCGIEENIYFHSPVNPAELLSRAAEHDVGLALEQPVSLSRKLAISNKFFFYLLSGLAVAVTNLPAQEYIMSTCPGAGFIYNPGDYQGLAGQINRFILEPKLLESSKQAALKAAQELWNWEKESKKLIERIRGLLQ